MPIDSNNFTVSLIRRKPPQSGLLTKCFLSFKSYATNKLENLKMAEFLPELSTEVETKSALLPQTICEEVLLEKYAKGDDRCAADVYKRVARALAEAEAPEQRAHWEKQFLQALHGGFIPAGRIQSAAGTSLAATLINCFVQPVGDSITQ